MLKRVSRLIGVSVVLCGGKAMVGQNYVQLAPSANQTVVQPSGTQLSVNNLAIPGTISFGTGSNSAVVQGNKSYFVIGYNGGGDSDPSFATANVGPLIIHDSSDNYASVGISNDGGELTLTSGSDGGIVLKASAGNGYVISNIWDSFQVRDDSSITHEIPFCINAEDNDFVGIAGPNACFAYDLLDISNRETFGNGNMHWWLHGATPQWSNDGTTTASGWNAGFSNPSAGVITLDTTVDGNGAGTLKVGKIEVAGTVTLSSNAGGSLVFQDGTVQSTAWNGVLSGGDYAESVNVTGFREAYEAGDVLVIDPDSEGKFLKSSTPYSTAVTGIFSTKPGLIGRRQHTDRTHMTEEVPMAMTGIVPTRVSAENGPIRPGDLLVTSSRPGYAMKGTDRNRLTGAIIGKAIGHLDSGVGVIEVVVALQ